MRRFSPALFVIFGSLCTSISIFPSSNLKAETQEIFNGTDLTGWNGISENWSVENGAITGRSTAEKPLANNTFLVWDGTTEDFELELDYKIEGGNSGIQYRSKVLDEEKKIVGGYQADIDSTPRYTGINYEEKGRGILVERGEIVSIAEDGSKTKIGTCGDREALNEKLNANDWNHYKIIAKGNNLQHMINGILMSETQDHQTSAAAASGVLALQLHAGPPMTVQFKNIKLTKITKAD